MRIVIISDSLTLTHSEKVNERIESHHKLVIESITSAIANFGHDVVSIVADDELKEQVQKNKPHIVFNRSIKEANQSGLAYTPSLLDKLHIPYTGSSAEVCISAFNKNKTKRILQEAGIPTSKSCLISDSGEIRIPNTLSFPLFIKPIEGGCSYGIYDKNLVLSVESCIKNVKAIIEETQKPVLVEEFLTGREFTVGIVGNNPPQAFPILEFIYDTFENQNYQFRSFKTKMIEGRGEKKSCPAILSEIEEDKIKKLAIDTYRTIGCRDYARIDIRCNKYSIPHILEVNALPSLIPHRSSFADMAETAGYSFENLIGAILISAFERYDIHFRHEDYHS